MSTQNGTDKPSNGRGERDKTPYVRPILSPETALEIVQTSLDYAKRSGLTVRIGNRNGLCVIAIGGAVWNDDTHRLCVTTNHDDTQGGAA